VEHAIDHLQIARNLQLYKFEHETCTQVDIIFVGYRQETIAIEFIFIQVIEISIIRSEIDPAIVQS